MRKLIVLLVCIFSVFAFTASVPVSAAEYPYIGQPEILVRSSDHTTLKLNDPSGKIVGITTFQNGCIIYGDSEPIEVKIDGDLGTVYARIPLDIYTSKDFYASKPIRREYLYVVKMTPRYGADYILLLGYNNLFNDVITSDGLGYTNCPVHLGVDSNSDGGFIFFYGGNNWISDVVVSYKNGTFVAGSREDLNPYVGELIKSTSRTII